MAATKLKYELTCTICLDIYNCPVMLNCGHNFCMACIEQLIEIQSGNGYCPECRGTCTPEDLRVNFKLGNIVEDYKSMQGCHSSNGQPCTYCILFPNTAIKTCLHCEASFCTQHLEVHSKSKEHILVDPTTSLQNRKCQIHNEVFKYFCIKDKSCICVSCCLVGEHKGHVVELLEKASQDKKEELKKVLDSLKLEQKALKRRRNVLNVFLNQKKEKIKKVRKDLDATYRELREHIVDAHVNVVKEVGRHVGQVSKQILRDLSSVEKRAAKLSEELDLVRVVCSKMDPLTVLQDKISSAICDRKVKAQLDVEDRPASRAQSMDMLLISLISQKSMEDLLDKLPLLLSSKFSYKVNILLNKASASHYLALSADLKTIRYSKKTLYREPSPDQFKTSQVLSISSFSSGKHFWEVQTSGNGVKAIGVAYPTIERSGLRAFLGYNEKSWCLIWGHDHIELCHNSHCMQIASVGPTMCAVGVFLDYEAGLLSFYRLCAQIEHLHTVTARFTEPLHAAFYVVDSWIKINPHK